MVRFVGIRMLVSRGGRRRWSDGQLASAHQTLGFVAYSHHHRIRGGGGVVARCVAGVYQRRS